MPHFQLTKKNTKYRASENKQIFLTESEGIGGTTSVLLGISFWCESTTYSTECKFHTFPLRQHNLSGNAQCYSICSVYN